MNNECAATYIRENFQPADRLAVVLLNKAAGSVIQRLAEAEKIAAPDFQAWLKFENDRRLEVYISMNALREGARGRTKGDVAAIRHVYLDFDDRGTAAVEALLKRADLPKPNYLVNTSPDKWQVIWKVDGFAKKQAEALQGGLARETGADPAATVCARVLRLPGFYNHKYARPHLVRAESLAAETYRPEQFPKIAAGERIDRTGDTHLSAGRARPRGALSQSERDWAYAKRALARGESPALVATAIASYRRYDKSNPQYYGELTVRKATASLRDEQSWVVSAEQERT
jgi:hypothetical protein